MLADYPAVIRLYRAEKDDEALHDPHLMHFAAVAFARTGKMNQAQDLWAAAQDRPDARACEREPP